MNTKKAALSLALLCSVVYAEQTPSLHEVCRNGLKEEAQRLINEGTDINLVHEKSGNTALMEAAREFDVELVRMLTDNENIEINACNKAGNNALMEAFSSGQACTEADCSDKVALNEIVSLLIERD